MLRSYITILLFAFLFELATSITLRMKKQYILVQINSNYTFHLYISQSNSQITPINTSLQHEVFNTISTINQYFDYFKYLSGEDLQCYVTSIGNSSYLYPCPFILNNDSALRVVYNNDDLLEQFSDFSKFNSLNETFIIDNTPYPFPTGAYPYSDLYISSSTNLTISFTNNYKNLGIRLLFITITLLFVYGFVILALVYKTNKIEKQMIKRKPDYKLKRRGSQISKDDAKSSSDQSDIDDYEKVKPNELTFRQSNNRSFKQNQSIPSIISSSRHSQKEDLREI